MHWVIYQSIHWSILDRLSGDTRSSTFDISVEYQLMYQPILLSVDILDGLPILHRCFTDTLPSLNVLVDIS